MKEGQRITKPGERYMIDMSDNNMVSLIILLTQRGFDLFDADGKVAFDKPEVAELIAWFVRRRRTLVLYLALAAVFFCAIYFILPPPNC